MSHRTDVARGRDVVARWCALAEQRLESLAELFETGRWRRFHSEPAFLENIQEAKTAVETWRDLSMREALRDNSAIDMSWLGRTPATLPPSARSRDQIKRLQPQQPEIPAAPPPGVLIVPETALLRADQASPAPPLAPAFELTRN